MLAAVIAGFPGWYPGKPRIRVRERRRCFDMGFQTKEDLLKKWTGTTEAREEAKEIKAIRNDIAAARAILLDGLARYKKKKLKVRSVKAADEDPFAELGDYSSEAEIQDSYGWGFITEARMDHLISLWRLREESRARAKAEDGQYHDRVTDMLESALGNIGLEYLDQLDAYDEKMRTMDREAEKTARENNERTFKREHGEMI
jgi:hypothetical protein